MDISGHTQDQTEQLYSAISLGLETQAQGSRLEDNAHALRLVLYKNDGGQFLPLSTATKTRLQEILRHGALLPNAKPRRS